MADKEIENGETGKFEAFYREYFNGVFQYVHRRIPDVQTAEDIVQETFCTAYAKGEVFLEHSQPKLWLLRTAKNKICELRRRMRYRVTIPLEEELELGCEESRYRVKELEVMALKTVGLTGWELVKDYYIYGITIPELAKAEGISENNMRVRLSRLKKKLREEGKI